MAHVKNRWKLADLASARPASFSFYGEGVAKGIVFFVGSWHPALLTVWNGTTGSARLVIDPYRVIDPIRLPIVGPKQHFELVQNNIIDWSKTILIGFGSARRFFSCRCVSVSLDRSVPGNADRAVPSGSQRFW